MRNMLIAIIALGCAGEPDPRWEQQTLTNQGWICIEGEADAMATASVNAGICLSSSCSRNAEGSCTAAVEGSTITLTSDFSWEQAMGDIPCTEDCRQLVVTCEVGVLAGGSYAVVLGEEESEVTIPAEPCPEW